MIMKRLMTLVLALAAGITINSGTVAAYGGTAANNYSEPIIGSVVSFNPNGGIVRPGARITEAGGTLAVWPVPTRQGYIFDGWYTAPLGGTRIETGEVFVSNTTVYALWSEPASRPRRAVAPFEPSRRSVIGAWTALPAFDPRKIDHRDAMSSAKAVATDVRRSPTNYVTAEDILYDIRVTLPGGSEAEWSPLAPFNLTPATETSEGRIRGIITVTTGEQSSAVIFDIPIPTH